MDSKVFFDIVRPLFGGALTQSQVDGMNATIKAFTLYGDGDINKLAYALATEKRETGDEMQPIYERGSKAYFKKYEGRADLGNIKAGDGYLYRGRGKVQITGRRNYAFWGKRLGIDLVGNPDLALDPAIAVRLLVEGALLGVYTGKALGSYIDGIDEDDAEDLREYVAARRVINGQDHAKEIGQSALVFEKALRAAGALAPTPPAYQPGDTDEPSQPPVAVPVDGAPPFVTLSFVVIVILLLIAAVFFLFA